MPLKRVPGLRIHSQKITKNFLILAMQIVPPVMDPGIHVAKAHCCLVRYHLDAADIVQPVIDYKLVLLIAPSVERR